MELKIIEGSRIKAGDVLVVVPDQWLTQEQLVACADYAQQCGIRVFFLPPNAKVYIKEQDEAPTATITTMDGTTFEVPVARPPTRQLYERLIAYCGGRTVMDPELLKYIDALIEGLDHAPGS